MRKLMLVGVLLLIGGFSAKAIYTNVVNVPKYDIKVKQNKPWWQETGRLNGIYDMETNKGK